MQKTEIGSTPLPQQRRGLKGKVIGGKNEIQDYMTRVASLIKRHVPPDVSQMQQSFQFGNATIQPSGSRLVTLVFRNYARSVTLSRWPSTLPRKRSEAMM